MLEESPVPDRPVSPPTTRRRQPLGFSRATVECRMSYDGSIVRRMNLDSDHAVRGGVQAGQHP